MFKRTPKSRPPLTLTKTMVVAAIDILLCLLFPRRAWHSRRMRQHSLEHLQAQRILVVRTDHIGDAFLAMPALAWLRLRFPEAHITVLAASWAAVLFEAADLHDDLIVCDPPWWVSRRKARFGGDGRGSWLALLRVVCKLRAQQFDLCVELRGDVRQIIAFGVLSNARVLLTRSRNGGTVLADAAPLIDEAMHESEQNMQLVYRLGGMAHAPIFPRPAFPKPYAQADCDSLRHVLNHYPTAKDGAPCILIHPGAKWVNRWPESAFVALMQWLAEATQASVLLTGSSSEAPLCERLAASMPGRAINLAGALTLTQHGALLDQVDLIVMADTGPMHFLNASTTPAFLLFGPTPAARFAPRRAGIHIIQGEPCCSAFLHERCTRVASGQPSACMAAITLGQVQNLVTQALRQDF